jgi:hypothetical protein
MHQHLNEGAAMSVGIWFWVIMVIGIIFWGFVTWRPVPGNPYYASGPNLVIFILIFLLGWGVFGPPIHG